MIENLKMGSRAKNWAQAKANAQLDGFILPQDFVERAEAFVEGIITLEQLEDFYVSLLPNKETLLAMYEQYDPGYIDVRIDDQQSWAKKCAEKDALLINEIVFNGMTVRSIMGMQIALGTYKSLSEQEKQGNV